MSVYLPFPLSDFYDALISSNLKQKLQPFIAQFIKKNIYIIYQCINRVIQILNNKTQLPIMKFNSLLAIRYFFDTCQYPAIIFIEVYLLPILYEIALEKYKKRSLQGISLYFIDRGAENNNQNKRLGFNYVQLASQLIFNFAKVKPYRLVENQQLKQDSNFFRTVKILNTKNIIQNQKCIFFLPSYINQTRRKYLKKLKHLQPDTYISFIVSLFIQEINLNKKSQLDIKKLYLFGDSYLTSTIVNIIQEQLTNIQLDFIHKKKYIALLNQLIRSGEIESIYLINSSQFLRQIAEEILKSRAQHQGIYPKLQVSKQQKKQFYNQYLKSIEIWATCMPFTQQGQRSQVFKIYQILKNKNIIFPKNVLLKKIQQQMQQNLILNQQRNQKLMKIIAQDQDRMSSSKFSKKSESQKLSQSSSKIQLKHHFSTHNHKPKAILLDQLQDKVSQAKKRISKLSINKQQIHLIMQNLKQFVQQWDQDLQKLDIQDQDPNQLQNLLDQGDMCCQKYNTIVSLYDLYKNKKISVENFMQRISLLQQNSNKSQRRSSSRKASDKLSKVNQSSDNQKSMDKLINKQKSINSNSNSKSKIRMNIEQYYNASKALTINNQKNYLDQQRQKNKIFKQEIYSYKNQNQKQTQKKSKFQDKLNNKDKKSQIQRNYQIINNQQNISKYQKQLKSSQSSKNEKLIQKLNQNNNQRKFYKQEYENKIINDNQLNQNQKKKNINNNVINHSIISKSSYYSQPTAKKNLEQRKSKFKQEYQQQHSDNDLFSDKKSRKISNQSKGKVIIIKSPKKKQPKLSMKKVEQIPHYNLAVKKNEYEITYKQMNQQKQKQKFVKKNHIIIKSNLKFFQQKIKKQRCLSISQRNNIDNQQLFKRGHKLNLKTQRQFFNFLDKYQQQIKSKSKSNNQIQNQYIGIRKYNQNPKNNNFQKQRQSQKLDKLKSNFNQYNIQNQNINQQKMHISRLQHNTGIQIFSKNNKNFDKLYQINNDDYDYFKPRKIQRIVTELSPNNRKNNKKQIIDRNQKIYYKNENENNQNNQNNQNDKNTISTKNITKNYSLKSQQMIDMINQPDIFPALDSYYSEIQSIKQAKNKYNPQPRIKQFKQCFNNPTKQTYKLNSSNNNKINQKSIIQNNKSYNFLNLNNKNSKLTKLTKSKSIFDLINQKNVLNSIYQYKTQKQKSKFIGSIPIVSKNHLEQLKNNIDHNKIISNTNKYYYQSQYQPQTTKKDTLNYNKKRQNSYNDNRKQYSEKLYRIKSVESKSSNKNKNQKESFNDSDNNSNQQFQAFKKININMKTQYYTQSESDNKKNNKKIINVEKYQIFFKRKYNGNKKDIKNLLKKKGLIIKDQQIQLGYIISVKAQKVFITLFLTPFKSKIYNIQIVQKDQSNKDLQINMVLEKDPIIEQNKQQSFTFQIKQNSVFFGILPQMYLEFKQKNRIFRYNFLIPISLLLFCKLQESNFSFNNTQNKVILSTNLFKSKIQKIQKIKQYWPSLVVNRQNQSKFNHLTGNLTFEENSYYICFKIDELNRLMKIQGIAKSKSNKNNQLLQYLLSTFQFILEQT